MSVAWDDLKSPECYDLIAKTSVGTWDLINGVDGWVLRCPVFVPGAVVAEYGSSPRLVIGKVRRADAVVVAESAIGKVKR